MFNGAAFAPLSNDKSVSVFNVVYSSAHNIPFGLSGPVHSCGPSVLRCGDSVTRHFCRVPFAKEGELVWLVVCKYCGYVDIYFYRTNFRLVLCLHLGAICALVGSILDLIQILIRGEQAVNEGTDLGSVEGITTTREVFFAVSFGFQFIFYWAFVSQPPIGERPVSRGVRHSGSWERFGATGIITRYLSLAASLAVPLLQILYRNVNSFDMKGVLYDIAGGVQIALSMLFFLKLLHGVCVWAPRTSNILSKQKAVLVSIPVLTSMLISMWLGIGNVAECEDHVFFQESRQLTAWLTVDFTETVFGRFVQGITFYILILYTFCIVFILMNEEYRVPVKDVPVNINAKAEKVEKVAEKAEIVQVQDPSPIEVQDTQADRPYRARRRSSFRGLPALKFSDTSFQIFPTDDSTPDLQSEFILVRASQAMQFDVTANTRQSDSIASKLTREGSLWTAPSRFLRRLSSVRTGRSMGPGRDLENGSRVGFTLVAASNSTPAPPESESGMRSSASTAPRTSSAISSKWREKTQSSASANSENYRLPSYYSGPNTMPMDDSESQSPGIVPPVPPLPPIAIPNASRSRFSAPSPSSTSGLTTGTQSPVFGLNGVHTQSPRGDTRRPRGIESSEGVSTNTSRYSGVSALLRQQNELDKSIAALRLFSPAVTASGAATNPDTLSPLSEAMDPLPPIMSLRDASPVPDSPANDSPANDSPGFDAPGNDSSGLGGDTPDREERPDEDRLSRMAPSATQSEFTLSSFPIPPFGGSNSASSSTFPPMPSAINTQLEKRRMSVGASDRSSRRFSLAPSLRPPVPGSSVTQSPPEDDMTVLSPRVFKTPSGLTQYEITSFIGGKL